MCFIEIMNLKVDGFDSSFPVPFAHSGPVDTTMGDVDNCLNIEYTGDSGFSKCLTVCLNLRIRTDENPSLTNLIKCQSTNKVGIGFFDVTIDYECLLYIPPHVGTTLTKLTVVLFRFLNIKLSGRLSFPNSLIHLIVHDRILIFYSQRALSMLKYYRENPWSDFLTGQPGDLITKFH